MGLKSFLVEGVSGSGKSAVYDELQRRERFVDLFDGVFVRGRCARSAPR